ncbi:hypothetical protein [Croceicoccus bisphenolivorans]|uniref:hypothetical protein n=1 Tax=Croceicoccus bisphenolivorans TaxID=1783232 RepID=UPI000B26215D|nr:hypothetical protein [Croceicoccus bisphenolivorans]
MENSDKESGSGQQEPKGDVKPTSAPPYSKAFENFVENPDDVVGLLAYALYKRSIKEDIMRGQNVPGYSRNPQITVVSAFRSNSEILIADIVQRAILEATPDIEQNATASAIISSANSVKTHIDDKTSFKNALIANIFAWLISISIVAIILFISGKADVAQVLAQEALTASQVQSDSVKNESLIEVESKVDDRESVSQ